MRISDWSSDVCSSDLGTSAFITITPSSMVMLVIIVIASRGATASAALCMPRYHWLHEAREYARARFGVRSLRQGASARHRPRRCAARAHYRWLEQRHLRAAHHPRASPVPPSSSLSRSEEHTSELQSLMRISYAVFCLKKKKQNKQK